MKHVFVHILVLCMVTAGEVGATVSGIAVTAKCPEGTIKGDG